MGEDPRHYYMLELHYDNPTLRKGQYFDPVPSYFSLTEDTRVLQELERSRIHYLTPSDV